jgi:hypothetical protein
VRLTLTKEALEPGDEGKLNVTIDARCFVGRKTTLVWLNMEYGGKMAEMLVRISAESVKD